MTFRLSTILLIGCAVFAPRAEAQSSRLADSLLRRGLLDRAESEYYTAVRVQPRDPNARWALGRYLIARGALRIGATLLDEAIQFGFDKGTASTALARVYMDLGEYAAIAALPASPLSANEKARVRWLIDHPTRAIGPDSTVLVAYTRSSAEGFLGAARIRVNGQPLVALIEPRSGCGIRVSDTASVAAKLQAFPRGARDPRGVVAAADSIGFGRMTLTNVPLTVERLNAGAQAVMCLGALMRFAPTFDAKAGLITLRLGGRAPAPGANTGGFPFYDADGQTSIVRAGGLAPLSLPAVTAMLKDRRWTLDPRRGQIFIEP